MLQLPADPDDPERFERVRTALLAARLARPQPGRDDKVVTAWNGLAITALAEASVALGRPEFLDAATQCARSILDLHIVDGRLRRASLGGRVGDSAAILEDHAALATGLLTLYQLTGDASWLDAATGAARHRARPFRRPRPCRAAGTTPPTTPKQLMVRPADPLDGATPSGASTIAEALQLAAHLVPADRAERYAAAADVTLAERDAHPGPAAALGRALARCRRSRCARTDPDRGGLRPAAVGIAFRGPRIGARAERLSSAARSTPRSCCSTATGSPAPTPPTSAAGRMCDLPVTTAGDLAAALGWPCSVRRMSTAGRLTP